jgi:hypothetical protein
MGLLLDGTSTSPTFYFFTDFALRLLCLTALVHVGVTSGIEAQKKVRIMDVVEEAVERVLPSSHDRILLCEATEHDTRDSPRECRP